MKQRPRMQDIVLAVCSTWKVERHELLGRARPKPLADARQATMVLARDIAGLSYPAIGIALGRHHTTIMLGVRAVRAKQTRDRALSNQIDAARLRLETHRAPA